MKLKFLGTAAAEAAPALFCDCDYCEKARKAGGKNIRTRSQSVINDELLIDFPADTYLHVLHQGLPLHKIYHCIITHSHQDHFYMDELFMRGHGFSHLKDDRPFCVYGASAVYQKLSGDERIRNLVEANALRIFEVKPYVPFEVAGYTVTALEADHDPSATPVLYLIEKDGKTIFYAHDTGDFPEKTWDWLAEHKPSLDLVTFDDCYVLADARRGHMGFPTILEVKARMKELGVLTDDTVCVVNHFSHNKLLLHEEIEAAVHPEGFLVSYDGMEVEI